MVVAPNHDARVGVAIEEGSRHKRIAIARTQMKVLLLRPHHFTKGAVKTSYREPAAGEAHERIWVGGDDLFDLFKMTIRILLFKLNQCSKLSPEGSFFCTSSKFFAQNVMFQSVKRTISVMSAFASYSVSMCDWSRWRVAHHRRGL